MIFRFLPLRLFVALAFTVAWYSSTAHADVETGERIIAIGDLHGDLDSAHAAFRLAGAIDDSGQWKGGNLVVVQLGDYIGRSYEEREVLDFLLALRGQAADAGGAVHLLIGNHEIFGAELELNWVDEKAYAAFADIPGLDLSNPRLADIPLDKRPRCAALMPGGHYARQLAQFPVVLRLGDTIFVHGGVTPYWAEYGVDRINREVALWFAGEIDQPPPAQGRDAGRLTDNVTMSRHFSEEVDEADCALLATSLQILGAKRMIVAHSVQRAISARCDEQVWAIDVGMSRYYGGSVQVLEIHGDGSVSVLSE